MVTLRSVYIPNAPRPTLESLMAHAKKFGLDEKRGHRGVKSVYGSYKKLAADPLIQVGFDYLGENAFVALVEAVGYGHFATQARADHKAEHEQEGEDA